MTDKTLKMFFLKHIQLRKLQQTNVDELTRSFSANVPTFLDKFLHVPMHNAIGQEYFTKSQKRNRPLIMS